MVLVHLANAKDENIKVRLVYALFVFVYVLKNILGVKMSSHLLIHLFNCSGSGHKYHPFENDEY